MAKHGINKVILVGNLGKDPNKRVLDSGVTVVNFPLATTESYKDKNGKTTDKTEWHNIVMWRGLAETAFRHLRKGSTVYLEGKLTTRTWEGQDGKKNYKTEVEVDHMVMMQHSRENGVHSDQEDPIFANGIESVCREDNSNLSELSETADLLPLEH
jgi:single-strand DNA-binding protein